MFDEMVEHEERVRLGEEGWKERYYQEKFGLVGAEAQAERVRELVRAYVEGLCWVMRYYYDGVASWTWFYPFHYAPFASGGWAGGRAGGQAGWVGGGWMGGWLGVR